VLTLIPLGDLLLQLVKILTELLGMQAVVVVLHGMAYQQTTTVEEADLVAEDSVEILAQVGLKKLADYVLLVVVVEAVIVVAQHQVVQVL
jgi:hypothetical protein